ncbi:MAG TPA: efflux transporter outer membrane subunit [Ramlibacter sp.]|uniref:efflux transporter outer membrane subunit n=1 Tax=Ramlibacter sp. TaxID=1917967 RepID=UPI002C2A6C8C|nr:efflux transporter outer membrane subunit [Ramlibacter sp.]HVZ44890.1 efflux transporter outer membrane subunit [Ramlibacter sp.]
MRTTRRVIAAACAACTALLAGCALQPVYERPALPVPDGYPITSSSDPAALTAADIGWRDFLTDSRLRRLVEMALANNRDLRVAALHVEQVRAQYRIQRSAVSPQVGATASLAASGGGRGTSMRDYSVGLSFSWEIDFFGHLRSLSDAALAQYLATQQARNALRLLLVSQVADQYLATLADDEMIAVTRRTLAAAQASYDLTQVQMRAGTVTELDVRQAQTVVDQARANLAAQERARAQAENALVLLVGRAIPADLPPPTALDALQFVADIPAGLPSQLLTRRPDIMQAEAQLRAANANIGAARAAFFPSIGLTGSLGSASAALGGLFGAGSLAWGFLPSITVPIFNAGRLQAELDVATIQKDIGIAQYERAIQSAFREVADGLAARETYDREVQAMQALDAAAARSLELSQLQYRAGVAGYLTVLTAQRTSYDAQVALVQAKYARMSNLVDLYRSLGGGWRPRTQL